MSPGITILRDPGTRPETLVVEVRAPGFQRGLSRLNVEATVDTAYRMSPEERAQAIRAGFTNLDAMESWTVGAQYQLRLLEWQPLMDEDGVSHLGIRYRFALPELTGGSGERRFETVRVRARHITGEGLVIPTIPGQEGPRAEPGVIDPRAPGWAYAERRLHA